MRAYSRGGGLLTICSSRVGAYSRGVAFSKGANSRIYGMLSNLDTARLTKLYMTDFMYAAL